MVTICTPAGMTGGGSSPIVLSISTSRFTSVKPDRRANTAEPSSSTRAATVVWPRSWQCWARALSSAVPTPRRRAAGRTRGQTNPPVRDESSATPEPASTPSCSASSSSRAGVSEARISATLPARSPGTTSSRTWRHRSRSSSELAVRTVSTG
jgi:hypothetical protein